MVSTYSSALPVQAARSASGADRGAFARAAGLGQEDQGRGGPGQSPLRPHHRLRLRGTRVHWRGASSNALVNRPPRSQPRRQVRRRRLRLAHTPQRRGPARYPAGRRTQRVPPRLPPRACAHAPSPARVPRRRRSPSAPSCSAPLPGTRPSRPTPSALARRPRPFRAWGPRTSSPASCPRAPDPGGPTSVPSRWLLSLRLWTLLDDPPVLHLSRAPFSPMCHGHPQRPQALVAGSLRRFSGRRPLGSPEG